MLIGWGGVLQLSGKLKPCSEANAQVKALQLAGADVRIAKGEEKSLNNIFVCTCTYPDFFLLTV